MALNRALMKSRRTMLHYACEHGNAELLKEYLEQGVDINECNRYKETPLIIASRRGHEELVNLLLEMGGDFTIKETNTGRNALHMACRYDHITILKILLKHGADVNATTDIGSQTALHLAAEKGNLKIAETLLQNGAEINGKNAYGLTALHVACRNGSEQVIQFFLLNGADIHASTLNYKNTPILIAAEYGHENAFRLLLKNGANINDANVHGYTALHLSAYQGNNISLLKYLFKLGMDIEVKDQQGRTPLCYACTKPVLNLNIIELFLIEGADANSLFRGNAPMILYLHEEIARILTKYAIKIKAANHCKTEISLRRLLFGRQEFEDFHENCQQEILSLKNEGHFSTFVTFFHFVTADANKAGKYLTNPHINDKLAACNIKERYPIYGDMIEKNFVEGRRKLVMSNLSLRYLNFVAKQDIPYLCRFKILSYLSDDDLINFKLACDPRRVITY